MNTINTYTTFLFTAILASILFLTGCSSDDSTNNALPTPHFTLVTTLSNAEHTLPIYTESGTLKTGYNAMFFQIKTTEGELLQPTEITWKPTMQMQHMAHGCPASEITLANSSSAYHQGYLVFQMASNDSEFWSLTITYTVNGTNYTASGTIVVEQSPTRTVNTFIGSDNTRYVAAMAQPTAPRIGTNVMETVLYRMESMHQFTPVADYRFLVDPRMPSMGNHSSPSNTPLTSQTPGWYAGQLNLTMTGYWKINLQLLNAADEPLYGNAITAETPSSSLYFEVSW